MLFSRRNLLLATGGVAAPSAIGTLPRRAPAAGKIKTAAIYTVPVEQQWVSRIHKAAHDRQGARRHRIHLLRKGGQHRL